MEKISKAKLIAAFVRSRGASFVTIETQTQPSLLATHPETGEPNPWKGRVAKIARVNGVAGFIYQNAVNRQREREDREPDFEAFPRKWGNRLPGTAVVQHKGRHYLEVKVQKSIDHYYLDVETGSVVDNDQVEQYLRQPGPSRQGVDREVILRDYSFDAIQRITINGRELEVVG